MARADLIKKLFSSFISNDKKLFLKVANEIIADERKKNHVILANDLERVLRMSKKHDTALMSYMEHINNFNEEKDNRLVDIIYSEKCFDDLILSDEKTAELKEILLEFCNWDVLVSNGVPPTSRILFYGPPGCGKTLCAKALATEIGIPLMYVRFDALVSSYLGETASNIRKVFELAKNDSFVIFFDEFDAIGRSRSDESEHGEIKRVVNTFLQQIDNFKGQSLIVAATNYESSLDYAIWRRFDTTLRFDLPSDIEKIKLFNSKLRLFNGPNYTFKQFLKDTDFFSHSDVENVCRIIMRKCILNGTRVYTVKNIKEAIEKQKKLVLLRKS